MSYSKSDTTVLIKHGFLLSKHVNKLFCKADDACIEYFELACCKRRIDSDTT